MPLGYQERTGVRLLWGTANLFTHPRYQAGAATNPDPEVFAYAAAQVKHMLEVTQRLGGENYVLWGGREGYDTLLNTDLHREGQQLARFLHLVAEHKAKIGFEGQLLIEPKPMEPTKHQYDYDTQSVHGFLVRNGLDGEYKCNIEANHATLAGHSFHHEVAYAVANGVMGSIDANRGDPQNGWDTDQFPNSVEDLALPAVRDPPQRRPGAGRLQLRRQAASPEHRPHGPVPRPHRRPRHASPGRCWSRRTSSSAASWQPTRTPGTPAGTVTLGQRSSVAGRASPTWRRVSPRARSIRSRCPGARSASRTSSIAASGPSTARREAEAMGVVLGIDVSTTATKAIVIDDAGRVLGMASSEYPFEQPHPLWSEQHPQLWWDGTAEAIAGALERRGRHGGRRGCGGPHRPDARPGAARRGR